MKTCQELLGLAWIIGLVSACGEGATVPERFEYAHTVRDLLADPPEWRVLEGTQEPSIGVISPSRKAEVDGAGMPALIVPPHGAVTFQLEAADLPATLHARAGIDLGIFLRMHQQRLDGAVDFEILGDGQRLAHARLPLDATRPEGNAWVDLGGPEGLAFDRTLELTLRTTVVTPDGTPIAKVPAIEAGFGGLRLERLVSRSRSVALPEAPNVVLVLMDTLRADRLSAYGYERPTSPALEALAARGILHEEAYSTSSWTWPATASVLTGLSPAEHGVIGNSSSFLPAAAHTLAELLRENGLSTAAWSANPIVGPLRNFHQGFESFHGPTRAFRATAEFFEEVRTWLHEHAQHRFFLYLHLADSHAPLRPRNDSRQLLAAEVPSAADGRVNACRSELSKGQAWRTSGRLEVDALVAPEVQAWASDLYDASVHSGDHWLGELVLTLRELGLEDRTVLAFTSDHGEELFERGFFGHGQSLQRELVRAPLVVAGPGVPRGVRSRRVLSTRRLAPGLAALAGLALPGFADGASEILGRGPRPGAALCSTSAGFWNGQPGHGLLGIRQGPWSLQLCAEDLWSDETSRQLLYHLTDDPAERNDLAGHQPEQLEALRTTLREQVQAHESRRLGPGFEAGETTRALLDQLGYGGGD